MLYSTFLILLGVYLGQEYRLPSVRRVCDGVYEYFASLQETNGDGQIQERVSLLDVVAGWFVNRKQD